MSLVDMLVKRRPPKGSPQWYAAHDRPALQPTYSSGVPRVHPVMPIYKSRAKRTLS